MTWLTIGLFCAGCALLAFCGWAVVAGGAMRETEAPVRSARVRGPLKDGFCPVCRAPGVFLTKAGGPNRRYHICDPAAVQTHVWPPAFAVTDEAQPAQTVTTWPPAPPEAL